MRLDTCAPPGELKSSARLGHGHGFRMKRTAGRKQGPSVPHPATAPPGPPARRWLLLVAVAKYAAGNHRLPPLPGVVVDVNRLYEAMRHFGHLPLARTICLYNHQATRQAILEALKQIAADTLESDQVIVHFGGHGGWKLGGNSPMSDGATRYVLPYDANAIDPEQGGLSTRDLAEQLALIRASELVVILDCCYSGAHTGGFWRDLGDFHSERQSRHVMAAGQALEWAVESAAGSLFTQSLCDALQGQAGVRTSTDGLVSATATFEYAEGAVRSAVASTGHLQVPRNAAWGSSIYLTRPPKELLAEPGTNHRSAPAALDALAAQLRLWFDALGYRSEPHVAQQEDACQWIINVPQRRGYDRILVRAIAGQGRLAEVDALRAAVRTHRVDEGWLVAACVLDQTVRDALERTASGMLYGYTFDELIEEHADLDGYFRWLDDQVKEMDIDRLYVPLACTKPEFHPVSGERVAETTYDARHRWMEGYLDTWLEHPGREHVSILGEFGMGKTWFALRYAWLLSQRYRDARTRRLPRPRVPLLIPLRDYAKAVTVESLFSEFFFRKHEFRLPGYRAFEQLNAIGRLLLIFDGFDEMALRVDRQKMREHFQELASVAVPGSKVILTSRLEHFSDISEAIEVLNRGPVQFDLLELERFDNRQVREALARQTSATVVDQVMANEDLLDFARRPLMIQYILEALPDIAAGKPVDLPRVYLYALRRVMQRNILEERTFTSEADKFFFFSELAWTMLRNRQFKLNYRDFPDQVRRIFKDRIHEAKDLDHWRHDLQNSGILVHTEDGDYTPSHRSLLEFFVAYRFAAYLGIMAPDFVEPAANQSHLDKNLPPRPFTWTEYFQFETEPKADQRPTEVPSENAPIAYPLVGSETTSYKRRAIAPLTTFARDPSERLPDLEIVHGNSIALVFAAGMVSPEPESVQQLVDLALDQTGTVAWTAQSFLPYLKHHKQAEALARGMVSRSAQQCLRSGVAWVLGELGLPLPEVVEALRRTIRSFALGAKDSSADSWWEAAFALEKLDRLPPETAPKAPPRRPAKSTTPKPDSHTQPHPGQRCIALLVQHLPPRPKADALRRRWAACLRPSAKSSLRVDADDMVRFVQHAHDPSMLALFRKALDRIDFATDIQQRRVYRMVWLCGHLGARLEFTQACLQRVLAATRHPRASVRNCAVEALGKLGQPSAEVIRALERGLEDSYYRTRFHAAWALAELGATSALPKLSAALRLEPVLDVGREFMRARDKLAALDR
ncbi:MAG: NACHT domain-containing protein [Verrucomicrobia bacterium]|nr:NACHT domain-containing protein [Verrucomicrobiota bacterium]